MKRSKPGRSRKASPASEPAPGENRNNAKTDFDKGFDEPLFSPNVGTIAAFAVLTIALISVGCPGPVGHYLGEVSKVFEHSFHGTIITTVTTFLKSSCLTLFGNVDIGGPVQGKKPNYVQPETYEDDDLQEDNMEEQLRADGLDYAKSKITNDEDYLIRGSLDFAEDLLLKGRLEEAMNSYDSILMSHPMSPRAKCGRAKCLYRMAKVQQSNKLLEQSIMEYSSIVHSMENVPEALLLDAGRKLSKLQSFRGWKNRAIKTIDFLLEKFPANIELLKDVGVYCLESGADERAKQYFNRILSMNPEDHHALVHMGFIMNHLNEDHKLAIDFLTRGLEGSDPIIHHGRFYLALGRSLYMENRLDEAYEVYERGAQVGAFLSQLQRSTYNIMGITSRAWWTKEQTGAQKLLNHLEKNWQVIRNEALQVMSRNEEKFLLEREGLTHYGRWTEYFLYSRGLKNERNCVYVPETCSMLDKFKEDTSCTRGQIKFSLMKPNTHIYPHTGPTNCRIRAHLGLVVPTDIPPVIRVGHPSSGYRTWKEGEFIIFDDSFEHEVWHNGTSYRLVLIVDIWHPEISRHDRRTMHPI